MSATHDIHCWIQITSSKLLPSSKSFYGQLLSGWPCNPTASPRAFRSSEINELPFQLKLYSSRLLLICNASFGQLGPNRSQREAVRAVCLMYLYAELKHNYTKWYNAQVKSVRSTRQDSLMLPCYTLSNERCVFIFTYRHMLLIAASLILGLICSNFLPHRHTHAHVLLMLLLVSPCHRSSSFYDACEDVDKTILTESDVLPSNAHLCPWW